MRRTISNKELIMPNFIEYGYDSTDENGEFNVSESAPNWAKKEYEEYIKKINNNEPDENGVITQY